MRLHLPALVVALAVADPALACSVFRRPTADDLRYADVVARARLIDAVPGSTAKYRDNFGLNNSVFLTFEMIATYRGSGRDVWRVIWRGGDIEHVRQDATGGDPGQGFPIETLIIGGIYIIGIVPAEKQFLGRGCRGNCFADDRGRYYAELLTTHCSAGTPSAFKFSDALEDRVVRMLAEAQ